MTKEEFIRAALDADDEQIEKWSHVPDLVKTGFCDNPQCIDPHCLEPRVGVCHNVHGGTYVVVQYVTLDGTNVDLINGEPLPQSPSGYIDPDETIRLYGDHATAALCVHSEAAQLSAQATRSNDTSLVSKNRQELN